jgi:hypothetical protein
VQLKQSEVCSHCERISFINVLLVTCLLRLIRIMCELRHRVGRLVSAKRQGWLQKTKSKKRKRSKEPDDSLTLNVA